MEPCGACGRSAGGGHAVCAACVRREVEEARAEMAEALEKNRVLRGRAQAALESRALQPRRCDAEGRAAALDETLRAKILSVSQKVAYERWLAARMVESNAKQRTRLGHVGAELAQARQEAERRREALRRGLLWHMSECRRDVRAYQLHKVLQAFIFIPVEVSLPERAGAMDGISAVAGLPLPNNGMYSDLPTELVASALCLISKLVVMTAGYLRVTLPHPLFPCASIRHASVAGNSDCSEEDHYPLCPSSAATPHASFDTGLDLLRRNVVHLCMEGGGVPAGHLWPAEALLMNLWALQQYATEELLGSTGVPPSGLPLPLSLDPSDLHARAGGDNTSNIYDEQVEGDRGGAAVTAAAAAAQDYIYIADNHL